MYQASEAFLAELKENARFEHIRGQIGSISFDDDNILAMSYSNRASDTKDVSFGLAYVGQLQFALCDVDIPRGSWRNLRVAIEFGLTITPEDPEEEPTVEWIPAGVFFVTEALWTDTSINITANDAMTKFDKAFGIDQTSGTVYDFLRLICLRCGVNLGMSQADCAALPNGTEILGLYPNNDIKTCRDFLGWIAQTVGGFATIDRNGELVVRSWAGSSVVDSFTASDRIAGSIFSDFETAYAGISIVNIESKTTQYYGNQNGAVINLGSNPLLQYGTEDVKSRQRNALATVAQGIAWTPFQTSILSNLVYDLGDLIEMTGGVAGTETLTCCVMSIDWTIKELTSFQGYGADPALASGKSKTDKEISGLISQTSENELITYTFANAEMIELEEDVETSICQIRFATVNPRVVKIFHEFDLDVTASGNDPVECEIHYYLNDELLTYKPTTTWDNDGLHLVTPMYFLQSLERGQRYEWEVKIVMKNGSAVIDRDDAHAFLEGQGLVAVDKWDGLIEIVDDTYILELGGDAYFDYDDESVITTTKAPDVITINDSTYVLTLGGEAYFDYDDESVAINMVRPTETRITEDEEDRVTEDGETRITEGDY